MGEVLHVAALVPAGVGTCCLAVTSRGRLQAGELVASAVMIAAMIDVAFGLAVVPALAWALALVVCSIALAAGVRLRRGRGRAARSACGADVHTALGGLAAVPVLLLMGIAPSAAAGHSHGVGAAVLVLPAAAYTVWSVLLAARPQARPRERVQHATMGLSTLLMAAAALLGHG